MFFFYKHCFNSHEEHMQVREILPESLCVLWTVYSVTLHCVQLSTGTVSTWTSGTAVGSDAAVAVTGADARSSETLSLISGGSLGRKQRAVNTHLSTRLSVRPTIPPSVCLSV